MSISISALKYDVSAVVVVFLLALPLSLGVAPTPLLSGIIPAIIWGLMVDCSSGSNTTFFILARCDKKNGAKAKYFLEFRFY